MISSATRSLRLSVASILSVFLGSTGCPLISESELEARMDLDGDGVPRPEDCDDADAAVGAAATLFADADGDGVGSDAAAAACTGAEGFVAFGGDCDDTRSDVSPDAPELCDGVDNDCDGASDENDATNVTIWYFDRDGDGYGVDTDTIQSCEQLVGYAALPGDCDDADATVNPGIREVCDGRDEDCSGTVDDPYWWLDADADEFGRDDDRVLSCDSDVPGRAPAGGDCDDANPAINPAATERCDDENVDDDCDGLADDADMDVLGAAAAYLDSDGDGFGDVSSSLPAACELAAGYSWLGTDCDDARGDVNPGEAEVCYDGLDQNCDAVNDDDCDADGSLVGDDCDDQDPYVSPLRVEACGDEVDNNCDGEIAGTCHLYGEVPLDDADAVIAGYVSYDGAGSSVAGVGDTNGDGYDDVVVTSSYFNNYAGRSVLFHGPLSGDISWDDEGEAVTGCEPYDSASVIAKAGDLDGDGLDQWVVGASNLDPSAEYQYDGAVYLLGDTGTSLCDVAPAIVGDNQAYLGRALAGGADFSGDGFDDVAAAFPGRILYHQSTSEVLGGVGVFDTLTSGGGAGIDDASFMVIHPDAYGSFGTSLAFVGDLDGDGFTELATSDPGADVMAPDDGAAYVYRGGQTGVVASDDADSIVYGDATFGNVNRAGGAGDLDGDGRDDLLVQADLTQEVSGVFGFTFTPAGTIDVATATVHVGNEGTSYALGSSFANLGDVNGDGRDDLLLQSPSDYRMGGGLGAALLYFGPVAGSLTELDADAALYDDWGGSCATSMLGQVAAAGDVDADGLADLLVSDSWDCLNVNNGGLTWVFLGGS